VEIDLSKETAHCRILFTGGVRVAVPPSQPAIGDSSHQLKLTNVALDQHRLTLEADVSTAQAASLDLQTPWKIDSVDGGSQVPLGNGWVRVSFNDIPARSECARRRMTIDFQVR
jgi:hypothetical protein